MERCGGEGRRIGEFEGADKDWIGECVVDDAAAVGAMGYCGLL
jgi:hypothetical protein